MAILVIWRLHSRLIRFFEDGYFRILIYAPVCFGKSGKSPTKDRQEGSTSHIVPVIIETKIETNDEATDPSGLQLEVFQIQSLRVSHGCRNK